MVTAVSLGQVTNFQMPFFVKCMSIKYVHIAYIKVPSLISGKDFLINVSYITLLGKGKLGK